MYTVNSEVSIMMGKDASGKDIKKAFPVSYTQVGSQPKEGATRDETRKAILNTGVADVLSLLEGPDDKVLPILEALNYGLNLDARQTVRVANAPANVDPVKTLERAISAFVKAAGAQGVTMTEDEAKEFLTAQMKAKKAA